MAGGLLSGKRPMTSPHCQALQTWQYRFTKAPSRDPPQFSTTFALRLFVAAYTNGCGSVLQAFPQIREEPKNGGPQESAALRFKRPACNQGLRFFTEVAILMSPPSSPPHSGLAAVSFLARVEAWRT